MAISGEFGATALRALMGTNALLTPITYLVNEGALRSESDGCTRVVLLLTYLSRPIDRLIQAWVLPALTVGYLLFNIAIPQKLDLRIFKIVFLPACLVAGVGIALAISVLKVADAAFQLIVPYQTIYAICKAKRAVAEYFEWRARSEAIPVATATYTVMQLEPLNQNSDLNTSFNTSLEISFNGMVIATRRCCTNGVINLCPTGSREKASAIFNESSAINSNLLWFWVG